MSNGETTPTPTAYANEEPKATPTLPHANDDLENHAYSHL